MFKDPGLLRMLHYQARNARKCQDRQESLGFQTSRNLDLNLIDQADGESLQPVAYSMIEGHTMENRSMDNCWMVENDSTMNDHLREDHSMKGPSTMESHLTMKDCSIREGILLKALSMEGYWITKGYPTMEVRLIKVVDNHLNSVAALKAVSLWV